VLQTLFEASSKVLADEAVVKTMESGYEEVTPSASVQAFDTFARKEGARGLKLARDSMETAN
jgi:hypothetical protein